MDLTRVYNIVEILVGLTVIYAFWNRVIWSRIGPKVLAFFSQQVALSDELRIERTERQRAQELLSRVEYALRATNETNVSLKTRVEDMKCQLEEMGEKVEIWSQKFKAGLGFICVLIKTIENGSHNIPSIPDILSEDIEDWMEHGI